MADYNAGVHSMEGNKLVIVIYDVNADNGLSRRGRSRLCALLRTNMRGVTVQLNADRPFEDMSHIPNSGYNSDWFIRGNRIHVTISDLNHIEKESSKGKSWLVAYRQIVVGDLHIKLSAYKPKTISRRQYWSL